MLAYSFADSPSVSNDSLPFRWEYPDRNKSLNNCSLKQLLPVSSNLWHRSNVLLTKANAACLAILLLELLPPAALGPRQVYHTTNINQSSETDSSNLCCESVIASKRVESRGNKEFTAYLTNSE